jgi:hypothetical protein
VLAFSMWILDSRSDLRLGSLMVQDATLKEEPGWRVPLEKDSCSSCGVLPWEKLRRVCKQQTGGFNQDVCEGPQEDIRG